jgi:hypothetical protein
LNLARFLEPGVKKFYESIEPKKRREKVMQSCKNNAFYFSLGVRQTQFFAKFSGVLFIFGHF